MAAMSAGAMAQGMGNLERDAEQRQYRARPTPKGGEDEEDDGRDYGPREAYSRAYFNPHIVLVFLLAIGIPTIYIYLYVGAVWNPSARLDDLLVHIINLDEGIDRAALIAQYGLNATGVAALALLLPVDNIGVSLSSTLLTSPATAGLFAWRYYEASNSSLQSLQEVVDKVDRGDAEQWYTLVIPQNYTAAFVAQAVNVFDLSQLNDDFYALSLSGQLPSPLNGSYVNPIYEVCDQGRSYATNSFITAALTPALTGLASTTTATVYRDIAELPSGTSYLKASFLLAPVPVMPVNVHPVPYYGMNFFTYLAALVLWIGSTITLTVVVKFTEGVESKFFGTGRVDERLSVGFVLGMRVVMLSGIALVQAATVMSVLPAFGADGSIAYGKGVVFVWLWYCAFVYVSVLGSLLALVGPDVFQIPATLWLILQLTSSGAFMDDALQNGFYKVGRAFPLYYTVRSLRTLLFGSYYHIEQDALVLFGWAVWSLLVIAVMGTRRVEGRWQSLKQNALVHALRDTSGFSASNLHSPPPDYPIRPSSVSKRDLNAARSSRTLERPVDTAMVPKDEEEHKSAEMVGVGVGVDQRSQQPTAVAPEDTAQSAAANGTNG